MSRLINEEKLKENTRGIRSPPQKYFVKIAMHTLNKILVEKSKKIKIEIIERDEDEEDLLSQRRSLLPTYLHRAN